MTTSTLAPAAPLRVPARRREHLFFLAMAVLIAAAVFAGFARTYYLRPWFTSEALRPLFHVHGLLFTSWVALLLAQIGLVTGGRVALHRRLGALGAVIALSMILIGTATAVIRAREGFSPPGGPPPLVFMVIPVTDMVVFAALVGAGFAFRRRADVHKRLMVLATISLLAAPMARLPLDLLQAGPPAFFGLADLFLVPLIAYDLVTRRRVHRATLWGSLLIVASQPLRLMLGGSGVWLTVAGWVTGS